VKPEWLKGHPELFLRNQKRSLRFADYAPWESYVSSLGIVRGCRSRGSFGSIYLALVAILINGQERKRRLHLTLSYKDATRPANETERRS
jgi:hypothetical protein